MVTEKVELSSIDLRYESCRLKNPAVEKILLTSILHKGIRDPLQGTGNSNCNILLDGFKRYRCAQKLSIKILPFNILSEDEALGIIKLLRMSNARSMNILEQARLIDELKNVFKMSLSEIATHLEKSKSWVAMRSGVVNQMSNYVREQIFQGKFPAYSFMYTLRSFIRMNGIKTEEIDEFVKLVSGKGVSIRDIDLLARGFFRGDGSLSDQLRNGDIHWCLTNLKELGSTHGDCTQVEKKLLKEMEISFSYMNRVIYSSRDPRIKSNNFFSQAGIVAGGIVKKLGKFKSTLEGFCDRSSNT